MSIANTLLGVNTLSRVDSVASMPMTLSWIFVTPS